jgi:hypothetical protein
LAGPADGLASQFFVIEPIEVIGGGDSLFVLDEWLMVLLELGTRILIFQYGGD